ncbi:hypothetical protein [Chryseolinea soli]|uniref:Uncharacterized protein n=1 Tax=Chryseolinea soli TaxID=2321403 RepID=A0A385SVB1_9BACT|nr:hypothetical protein [Chryseolinea soli]AYB34752.1 hypothetical protein D4L85_31065 [Chryseolinea soli]
MLKNAHKVAFLDAVKEEGFNPYDFKPIEKKGVYTLSYRNTSMEFSMYDSTFGPDFFDIVPTKFSADQQSIDDQNIRFDRVIYRFRFWLKQHVKAYIKDRELEDPWKNLDKTTSEEFSNSETFTAQEVKLLEAKLDNFPTLAKSLPIDPSQMEILINEVKELRKDLNTSKPKKKWFREFTGFLVEAGKFILKDPEERQKVFAFLQDLVETAKHLLH